MKSHAVSYSTQDSQVAFVSQQVKGDDGEIGDLSDKPQRKDDGPAQVTEKIHHICHKFLNNMTAFVFIYAGGLMFYGMTISYTNSVLISIERRFGFSTKQIGLILAATELGHIAMALIVAHFVGTRNRPLWICFGTVLMGASILLFAAPEIIFPMPHSLLEHNATHVSGDARLCRVRSESVLISRNASTVPDQCVQTGDGVAGPIVVFCIAHILFGFGSTTPMVLGMPYIDDNVSPKVVPLYYGVALFFRILGPLIGFGLGAICNNFYFDLSKPPIQASDPGWISAWYIGFLVVSGGLFIFGVLMACFPSTMHGKEKIIKGRKSSRCGSLTAIGTVGGEEVVIARQISRSPTSPDAWKCLVVDLKRLMLNFTFVCRTCSMFVDGMIVAGFFNYLPKFYAQQFQLTQTSAALWGGLGLVIAVVLGVIVGSLAIKRFSLRPRSVGLMLVIPSLIMACGAFISTGLGCGNIDIQGLPSAADFRAGRGAFNNSFCSASSNCGCSPSDFSPVCETRSNTIFYSACHAGCQRTHITNKTKIFDNCTCASGLPFFTNPSPDNLNNSGRIRGPRVRGGLCPKSCPNFDALTAVLFISVFFVGIPMSGQVMVQFRLVDVDLKNLCAGVTSVAVAAFGLLPGPIFVGAIVDSTCRLWQIRDCGHGACMIYDNDQLRWKFFVTCGFLKIICLILDSVVTWRVWNWEFNRLPELAAKGDLEKDEPEEIDIKSIGLSPGDPGDSPAHPTYL